MPTRPGRWSATTRARPRPPSAAVRAGGSRGGIGAAARASGAGPRRTTVAARRQAPGAPPVAVARPCRRRGPPIRSRIGRWSSGRRTPRRPPPRPEPPPRASASPGAAHPGSQPRLVVVGRSRTGRVSAAGARRLRARSGAAAGVARADPRFVRPPADRPHRAHLRNGDRRVRPATARGAGRGHPVGLVAAARLMLSGTAEGHHGKARHLQQRGRQPDPGVDRAERPHRPRQGE